MERIPGDYYLPFRINRHQDSANSVSLAQCERGRWLNPTKSVNPHAVPTHRSPHIP
jgi:hypothetical protein